MTNEQLTKVIRAMVLKEAKAIVPALVKEVMASMLMESVMNNPAPTGNSHKRRALQEVSGNPADYAEYPSVNQNRRAALATAAGYGDMLTGNHGSDLIVSTALTENGTAIPVDPNSLPDHVVNALTRNYSDVMKALDKKKNGK
jgi:hypothetical protein